MCRALGLKDLGDALFCANAFGKRFQTTRRMRRRTTLSSVVIAPPCRRANVQRRIALALPVELHRRPEFGTWSKKIKEILLGDCAVETGPV